MNLPNTLLRDALRGVYFIWGSGKTTAANALARRHTCCVYHTDDRSRHFRRAHPEEQPAMCRDVPDFWALERDDALRWESAIVREMTPMIVLDLVQLAAVHKMILCEGDIDIDAVIPIVTHAVTISNHGESGDFFDRPDQRHMLDALQSRTDISDAEKQRRVANAYDILRGDGRENKYAPPRESVLYGVREIIRDNNTSIDQVTAEIEAYWNI